MASINETIARLATAGPRIEPTLLAAPAAPIPLVRVVGSVMSAMYAFAAGIDADMTLACIMRATMSRAEQQCAGEQARQAGVSAPS
jgi:hypothetical protein